MGDVLGGVFGSGGKQTSDQEVDPNTAKLNAIRLEQAQGLFSDQPSSIYGQFRSPNSTLTQVPQQVTDLYNSAASNSTIPTPEAAPNDYSNLMSFDDYLKMGLDASQNYINQIATPQIMSQAALMGLERGGMPEEAIAKASAQYSLPFIQSLPQASTALTLAKPQAEATRAQTGLTNAQRNFTGNQAGLVNAQRAQTLLPLADFGRGLQQQDYLRQQGVVTTGLTGLPYTPSISTDQSKSSQPLFNFFGQG